MLIFLVIDQTLEFPSFVAKYEMLRTKMFYRVALLIQRVDDLEYLIEDHHCIFLIDSFLSKVSRKSSGVRLRYQPYYILVGDLFLNFKEVVGEDHILWLSQHTSIEFQTLWDIELIDHICSQKFDVKRISILSVEAFLDFDFRSAKLLDLFGCHFDCCHYWRIALNN